MKRRTVLRAMGVSAFPLLAGCNESGGETSDYDPPDTFTPTGTPTPVSTAFEAERVGEGTVTFTPYMPGAAEEEHDATFAVTIGGGFDSLTIEKPGYKGWNDGAGLTVAERDVADAGTKELEVAVPSRYLYTEEFDTSVIRFRATSTRDDIKEAKRDLKVTVDIPAGWVVDPVVETGLAPDALPRVGNTVTFDDQTMNGVTREDIKAFRGFSSERADQWRGFVERLERGYYLGPDGDTKDIDPEKLETAESLDEFADYAQLPMIEFLVAKSEQFSGNSYESRRTPISGFAWEFSETMQYAYETFTGNKAAFTAWNSFGHGSYAGYDYATGDFLAFAIGNEGLPDSAEFHYHPQSDAWDDVADYFWYPLSEKYEEDYDAGRRERKNVGSRLQPDSPLDGEFYSYYGLMKDRTVEAVFGLAYSLLEAPSVDDSGLHMTRIRPTDEYLTAVRDELMSGSIAPERFDRILQQLVFTLHTQYEYMSNWGRAMPLFPCGSIDNFHLVRVRRADASSKLGDIRTRLYSADERVSFEWLVETMGAIDL